MFHLILNSFPKDTQTLLELIPTLEKDVSAQDFMREEFWTLGNTLLISGGVLLILIVVLLLYRKWARKKVTLPPAADVIALQAIDQLEERAPQSRELSIELSLILREYLTQEIQEPTLYETHQEFSGRINSLADVPPRFQFDLRNLLDELAELKYAPTQEQLKDQPFNRARQLIDGIAREKRQLEQEKLKTKPAKLS